MVAASAARGESGQQTLQVNLPFPGEGGQVAFDRADLVITGVDHSGISYEVRVFFNNPGATIATPRTAEEGYAGRFTVFGHGGCYGEEGHCEVPEPSTDPYDVRPPHPLTPLDTYLTVTEGLRRVLSLGKSLETVTLVPVSLPPRRADRAPAPELFTFDDISLQTYLASTEPAAAEV